MVNLDTGSSGCDCARTLDRPRSPNSYFAYQPNTIALSESRSVKGARLTRGDSSHGREAALNQRLTDNSNSSN